MNKTTQMTIPTESKLLPQIHGRTNPFKRLAAAVISQALGMLPVRWAGIGKSATTWLLQNDDGFPFWCNVLGMDPDQIRQELSDLLDSPIRQTHNSSQLKLEYLQEIINDKAPSRIDGVVIDVCSAQIVLQVLFWGRQRTPTQAPGYVGREHSKHLFKTHEGIKDLC